MIYYPETADRGVFFVSDGFAGIKGRKAIKEICDAIGFDTVPNDTRDLDSSPCPTSLRYVMDGKFPRVLLGRDFAPVEPKYSDVVPF